MKRNRDNKIIRSENFRREFSDSLRGMQDMILVDIYIPAVDGTYDFMLDENTEIEKIMLEIFEMISKKMQGGNREELDKFLLYNMNPDIQMDQDRMLKKHRTLSASGIRDGSRLMFV